MMMNLTLPRFLLLAVLTLAFAPLDFADDSSGAANLLALSSTTDLNTVATANNGATISLFTGGGSPGIQMKFPASKSYPGVALTQPPGGRNLSSCHGIDVDITNNGNTGINVAVRVDNAGDWKKSPWSSDHAFISPGETSTVHVPFGLFYGHPAYPLDSHHITSVEVSVVTPGEAGSLVIKAVHGTP